MLYFCMNVAKGVNRMLRLEFQGLCLQLNLCFSLPGMFLWHVSYIIIKHIPGDKPGDRWLITNPIDSHVNNHTSQSIVVHTTFLLHALQIKYDNIIKAKDNNINMVTFMKTHTYFLLSHFLLRSSL